MQKHDRGIAKRHVVLFALMISLGLLYRFFNRESNDLYCFSTCLDSMIPLINVFIVPYFLWYFYIAFIIVYLFIREPALFERSLVVLNIGMVVCYSIYFSFQTTVPRPPVEGDDLFAGMVRILYSIDQPFNCFPSLHVFYAYFLFLALCRSRLLTRAAVILVGLIGVAIVLSTLFLKQHCIADLAASFVLVHALDLMLGMVAGARQTKTDRPFLQDLPFTTGGTDN